MLLKNANVCGFDRLRLTEHAAGQPNYQLQDGHQLTNGTIQTNQLIKHSL